MITINKIHIKNFRSIVDETIELSDFNTFVGKNDSGKSNVLKALNLFFNGQTEVNTVFDFDKDYSKLAKRREKQAKEITISLDIVIPKTYAEAGIKTWTKTWRTDGLHQDNTTSMFRKGSKGFTFLDRIYYIYIPAVKSNEYFRFLLSQVYLSMTASANSTLFELNNQYSKKLREMTSTLSEELKSVLHLDSAIQMPQDLNVLFQDLTFSTSDKHVSQIDLNRRGDGIKARHIPAILRYMQQNTEKNKAKGAISNTYIWGFEEPENGVEYMSCFEMADELYDSRKERQILLTTHSPAFYNKHDQNDVTCYYVHKSEIGSSKYQKDVDQNTISEEIGFMPLVTPYIIQERKKYLDREKVLRQQLDEITQRYNQNVSRVVILTEGKTDIKHIRSAFETLELDGNIISRIDYYDFGNSTLGDELDKVLERIANIPSTNIYIGIYDRDKKVFSANSDGFVHIRNKVYKFNIPALDNEQRKPEDKICIEHYYTNEEIEKDTGSGHLYMWKDFDEFGQSSDGCFSLCYNPVYHNNPQILIIDSSRDKLQRKNANARIISKNDFADYVSENREEFNFENFRLIFDVICKIINDNSQNED